LFRSVGVVEYQSCPIWKNQQMTVFEGLQFYSGGNDG
jgi:hypothetical protein